VESQNLVATFYMRGVGTVADPAKAAFWYEKASAQGMPGATGDLALLYLNGDGVEKNVQKAVDLLKKSSEEGYPPAMFNLGVLYQTGQGIANDNTKALKWYIIAGQLNYGPAREAANLLSEDLSQIQLNQAQKEAKEWLETAVANAQSKSEGN